MFPACTWDAGEGGVNLCFVAAPLTSFLPYLCAPPYPNYHFLCLFVCGFSQTPQCALHINSTSGMLGVATLQEQPQTKTSETCCRNSQCPPSRKHFSHCVRQSFCNRMGFCLSFMVMHFVRCLFLLSSLLYFTSPLLLLLCHCFLHLPRKFFALKSLSQCLLIGGIQTNI